VSGSKPRKASSSLLLSSSALDGRLALALGWVFLIITSANAPKATQKQQPDGTPSAHITEPPQPPSAAPKQPGPVRKG